jgi:hypothetical protein
MKLSVRKRWGFVHVRGGRVLTVSHDHQISTSTFDRQADEAMAPTPESSLRLGAKPNQKRTFDAKWVTAKVGDLAVEIVVQKTGKILGYTYLCGDAINVVRYVNEGESERVASWFTLGRGMRFTIPLELELEPFIAAVMGIKYSGADVACARLEVSDDVYMEAALNGLLAAYAYEADGTEATTHMMVSAFVRKPKCMGTVHCQPKKHAQDFAAQPFLHELLLSSPELIDHPFVAPPGPAIEPPIGIPGMRSTIMVPYWFTIAFLFGCIGARVDFRRVSS